MEDKQRYIVQTSDGSPTLFVPELKEHYHSIHGSLTESKHIFIKYGLELILNNNNKINNILEFGLGTGLNLLLTLEYAGQIPIYYHSLEKYPLSTEEIHSLSASFSHYPFYDVIHHTPWEEDIHLNEQVVLRKDKVDFRDFKPQKSYHLVYFDAFAPDVQPKLWEQGVFDRIFNCMEWGGVLVTYCAKGQVKRNLKAAGFRVEALPGPPGKREMTRAWKEL